MSVQMKHTRGLIKAAADARNANEILEELARTFEAYKAENDARLADLVKNKSDPLQEEKLSKINADLTDLQNALDETNAALAAARLGGGGGAPLSQEVLEHQQAFNQFFRKGVSDSLTDLQVKAGLTTQSDPDGGYIVPEFIDQEIDRVLGTVSSFRQLARVLTLGVPTYKKLVNVGGTSSGWVGEEESRADTDTPKLRELAIEAMEIYAKPYITQTMLDDARLDVAAWLASEVSIEFEEQEGAAFITGDGAKKPRGILAYDKVANASYAWGKVGYVASGAAAGFHASTPGDNIIDLYYSLKAKHRNGASFLVSDAVMGSVRKFKDGQGNYLFAPPQGVDMPSTLMGKPVYTDDNMQALGANAFPLAFGNWNKAYTIIDRTGTRILRDPFTNAPYVRFYTTKRVGGGVTNFEAFKLLKCASS